MSRSEALPEVTITSGKDEDDGDYISVEVQYLASLIQAKQELRRIKRKQRLAYAAKLRSKEDRKPLGFRIAATANQAPPGQTAQACELRSPADSVTVQLGIAELVSQYPELIETSGWTIGQLADAHPELFDYTERDDC